MNDYEKDLLQHGSIEAAAAAIGREAAEAAMFSLTQHAPEEIAASWPMVIQWSRLQLAYEDASAIGDVKLAMQAAKMCADMISGMY